MTEAAVESSYSIAFAGLADVDPELISALQFMVAECRLADVLVSGIVELVPDPALWRLTLTGDVVSTVHELSERADDNPYTIDRGAGHVGAITLPQDDGTFDIVMSVDVLFRTPDGMEPDQFIPHILAVAAHLSRHEAGHAALALRAEDTTTYQNVDGLTATAAVYRKPLACHVDDNRIEQYTAIRAPSPFLHADHLGDAIAHLRTELNEAKRTWADDIDAAVFRTLDAANGLIRVLAYLAPELGRDTDGTPNRPDPRPEGWAEYVEDSWDAWSLTFHRLRPADEPMTTAELGGVLFDLCRLTTAWLSSIGVTHGSTDDDREFMFWEKDRY